MTNMGTSPQLSTPLHQCVHQWLIIHQIQSFASLTIISEIKFDIPAKYFLLLWNFLFVHFKFFVSSLSLSRFSCDSQISRLLIKLLCGWEFFGLSNFLPRIGRLLFENIRTYLQNIWPNICLLNGCQSQIEKTNQCFNYMRKLLWPNSSLEFSSINHHQDDNFFKIFWIF